FGSVIGWLIVMAPAVALPMRSTPALMLFSSPWVRPREPAVLVPRSMGGPATEVARGVTAVPLLAVPWVFRSVGARGRRPLGVGAMRLPRWVMLMVPPRALLVTPPKVARAWAGAAAWVTLMLPEVELSACRFWARVLTVMPVAAPRLSRPAWMGLTPAETTEP